MAKTLIKNKSGNALDLDGARVIVADKNGADIILNDELAALRAAIAGLASAAGAMTFKGVVNGETSLPASGYIAGWTYKVGAAGVYAGQVCEAGDMIICVQDHGAAASDSDWQVVQTNIDGAVTGPASAIVGNFAAFDAETGKVIKDSEVKMADATDAIAKKHAHANMEVVNALGKNADNRLTYDGSVVGGDQVDCVVLNAGDPIPENLRDNGVIFEIQTA